MTDAPTPVPSSIEAIQPKAVSERLDGNGWIISTTGPTHYEPDGRLTIEHPVGVNVSISSSMHGDYDVYRPTGTDIFTVTEDVSLQEALDAIVERANHDRHRLRTRTLREALGNLRDALSKAISGRTRNNRA